MATVETTTDICKFRLNYELLLSHNGIDRSLAPTNCCIAEHLRRSNRLTPTMTHPPLQSRTPKPIHAHSIATHLVISLATSGRSHRTCMCACAFGCLLTLSFCRSFSHSVFVSLNGAIALISAYARHSPSYKMFHFSVFNGLTLSSTPPIQLKRQSQPKQSFCTVHVSYVSVARFAFFRSNKMSNFNFNTIQNVIWKLLPLVFFFPYTHFY